MPEEEREKLTLDKGKLDFGQVLFDHLIGMLRKLRESDYAGFINAIDGFYLILYPYTLKDNAFLEQDVKLFSQLTNDQISISNDIRLWPEDQNLILSNLGLEVAKKRLGNLMVLAEKNNLLLSKVDRDEVWELPSEEGENANANDDTNVEI
jgi:hypothetical protein